MLGDPLADILELANAEPSVTGGLTAGGEWAVRFPPPDQIKFFAIGKGSLWFIGEGRMPLKLEAGDVVMLSAPLPFTLASDPAVATVAAEEIFSDPGNQFPKLGTREDCIMFGGHVRLDPRGGRALEELLPPFIHIRSSRPEAGTLRWLIDQSIVENRDGGPASVLAIAQLTRLLFIQVLRVHLASGKSKAGGISRVIVDPRLLPALRRMHGNPAHPWTLEELARAAAMSRTSFAVTFREVAGITPVAYLTRHRMALAKRALRSERVAISLLAERLGYTSQAAFTNAFKRVAGMSPQKYRSEAGG